MKQEIFEKDDIKNIEKISPKIYEIIIKKLDGKITKRRYRKINKKYLQINRQLLSNFIIKNRKCLLCYNKEIFKSECTNNNKNWFKKHILTDMHFDNLIEEWEKEERMRKRKKGENNE